MTRKRTAAFANEVGASFDMPNLGTGKIFEAEFVRMSAEVDAWVRTRATAELQAAQAKAEAEQTFYRSKLVELNNLLDEKIAIIDFSRETNRLGDGTSIPSYDDLEKVFRGNHATLMEAVQEMHRETLKFHFTYHLVGKETAAALADLYEIK